ncbi:uncharacterized protein [Lolium perenne]|uniref:uncharacterized protein n=1 Tax=Lolium perenne TaxID=4522 RepID=UPI003A9A1D9A
MHSSGVSLLLAAHNWQNFAPVKVRVFFWIARHGNTRTRAMLHRHGCLPSPRCPFCVEEEDLLHLFYRCPRLMPVFAALGVPVFTSVCNLQDVCAALATPFAAHSPLVRHTLVLLLLWITWKSRNTMVFDAIRLSPRQTISLVLSHGDLWLHRLPRRSSRLPLETWLAALRAL